MFNLDGLKQITEAVALNYLASIIKQDLMSNFSVEKSDLSKEVALDVGKNKA